MFSSPNYLTHKNTFVSSTIDNNRYLTIFPWQHHNFANQSAGGLATFVAVTLTADEEEIMIWIRIQYCEYLSEAMHDLL